MRPRRETALLLVAWLLACGDPSVPASPAPSTVSGSPEPAGTRPVRLPAIDDGERLVQAHHLIVVSGEVKRAQELLSSVLARSTNPRSLRARAALELAELAEVGGERRQALVYLEKAKTVTGPGHPLALEADDRRARILTANPLVDVRGPVPGSVPLKQEPPAVAAQFRGAEQLLARYHRVVVAPQLENINEVLRAKRRSLAVAAASYQKVVAAATGPGKAAAQFRLGAMYHHLAEALAFAIPSELLPSMARQLRRQLQAESTAYLRRALSHYREAAAVPSGTSPWRQLARREAETLELVLRPAGSRRRGK